MSARAFAYGCRYVYLVPEKILTQNVRLSIHELFGYSSRYAVRLPCSMRYGGRSSAPISYMAESNEMTATFWTADEGVAHASRRVRGVGWYWVSCAAEQAGNSQINPLILNLLMLHVC